MKNPIITNNAYKQIEKILNKEINNSKLRISVLGGGCSGFQYKYDIVTKFNNDDLILSHNNIQVLIDSLSLPFLKNSKIDFINNIEGSSFKITNPNTVSECSCGTSFSI